jgi:iron only hydrogenase large subunit-like protein
LDVNFCVGGCIGGPLLKKDLNLNQKKKKATKIFELSKNLTYSSKK